MSENNKFFRELPPINRSTFPAQDEVAEIIKYGRIRNQKAYTAPNWPSCNTGNEKEKITGFGSRRFRHLPGCP